MLDLKSRAAGSLIGQCLGDALGFPVEGRSPEVCSRYVADTLRTSRAGERGRRGFRFGQYTDDSQLARELLQSIVRCGGFDPSNYARAIADTFTSGRIVGRGRATEAAARRIAAGVPWNQAGTPAPSAGNGSAMRAGPVGILFYDDPTALVRVAHKQGRITHTDPRCSAGAVVIAGAVAQAMRPILPPLDLLVEELAGLAEALDPVLAAAMHAMERTVTLPPMEAAAVISKVGIEPGYADRWRGISPFVTPSVLWAVYSFLRSPDDYWETICTAIAVGGDVDTTAAMAGAISGAHVGLEGLPHELARRVNDQGTWGYEELVCLVEDALEVRKGQSG